MQRIIEVNRTLPSDRKIRALAIARGGRPEDKGYADFLASTQEATAEGIFVISSDLAETHGLSFHGMGRNSLSDPNQFESYGPGLWWRDDFYEQGIQAGTLLVPMDSRTTASPTGAEDYVFYHEGGWSWSIPYLAGMYILAVQVKPEITPDEFWATALNTGRTIQIRQAGKDHDLGILLDPQALIETLKSK